jgi:hypothetical protein
VLATHPRCYGQHQDIFNPLHYLTLLEQRPGAFDYAKPIKRWKEDWPPVYHHLLNLLKEKEKQAVSNSSTLNGSSSSSGVKEFVRILALHKEYSPDLVEKAISQALSYGCPHLEGVRQCLHQLTTPSPTVALLDLSTRPQLAQLGSQSVDLNCYDQLLERQG